MSRHSRHPWALGTECMWTVKDVHHCTVFPLSPFTFFVDYVVGFFGLFPPPHPLFTVFYRTEDISVVDNLQTSL